MQTHIFVSKELQQYFESRGYSVSGKSNGDLLFGFLKTPMTATHPATGSIEIEFCGENITVEDNTLYLPDDMLTRSEQLTIKRLEKTSMGEEAAKATVYRLVCKTLAKLHSPSNPRRFGVAFPNTHNFVTALGPLITHLLFSRVEICLVESWGGVLHLPDQLPQSTTTQLTPGAGLLLEGL